ncbi:MAG: signal recognition particle-docking protein FtsY [Pseudomonadota bacterium]
MSDAKSKGKSPGMFGRLFGKGDAQSLPSEQSEDAASDGVVASDANAADLVAESGKPEPGSGDGEASGMDAPKKSWFAKLKSGLSKTSGQLTGGITGLFTKTKLDPETLEDFEDLLIQADLGVATASRITETLSKSRVDKTLTPDAVRQVLIEEVERVLEPVAKPLVIEPSRKPHVILMVGVNGTGKTTTIGKLASKYRADGLSVMLAAGDTFRAAAIDQLTVWGERTGCEVVSREAGSDSSGLAFDALKKATEQGTDVVLIDTAGRLQNKQVLMEELEKVVRVIQKIEPSAPHDVLLVLDATTGQNALQQVEAFRDRAGVTGLVMTKLDGTARGGILVAISEKYRLPVHAIGVGEGTDDLQPFEPAEFAKAIAAS